MATRNEKDRAKQIQDKCQTILTQLLKDEDNKYCVDCDAKGPRWASWNLGIFLCIRCAGIHRNLGVHISKVKSVNLDAWTPEQVVSLQQMGNSRARAVYEANLPDAFRRPQTDVTLEAFVRAKYEHRKYVAREWVPPSPPQVNWDKEIDEEMERQKKKKKSSSSTALGGASLPIAEKKPAKSEVIPQPLPKPKSSASPKPGRATPKRDSAGASDLLRLGNNKPQPVADLISQPQPADDVFSGFLSAPQATQEPVKDPKETKALELKNEEESFFNQPAPSEKEKSKMTKDSILALYGQAPTATQNTTAFNTQPAQNGLFGNAFPQNQTPFGQNNQNQQPFGQTAQNQTAFGTQNQTPFGQNQNQSAFGQNNQNQPTFGNQNQAGFAQNQSAFAAQNQNAFGQNSQAFGQNQTGFANQFQQSQPQGFAQPFGNFQTQPNNFLQNGQNGQMMGQQQPQQGANYSGFNQFAAQQPQNNFGQFQQQFGGAQNATQPTFPTSFGTQQNQNFTQQTTQFPNSNGAFNGSNPAANNGAFFNRQQNTNSLQQQFGGISLGGGSGVASSMNAFPGGQALAGAFPAKAQGSMATNSVWQ